jgi:hypothetical protein
LNQLEIHKDCKGFVSNALTGHGKSRWVSAKKTLKKARGEV